MEVVGMDKLKTMRKVPRHLPAAVQGRDHNVAAAAAQRLIASSASTGAAMLPDMFAEVYCHVQTTLGKGAHGEVRLAEMRTTGELHAVKCFMKRGDGEHEAKLLRTLKHPNIIKLLEVYMPTAARPQIVLAFTAADCDLYRLMKMKPHLRLSDMLASSLARQLAEALAHMHSKRIVHRDLKPANILVVIDGDCAGGIQLQVADFGAARLLPDAVHCRVPYKVESDANHQYAVNAPCALTPGLCTPCYSAPEAFFKPERRGQKVNYGTAADIWSFGAIAFEMVMGMVLAPGGQSAELVAYWMRRIGAPGTKLRNNHAEWFQDADKVNLARVLSVSDAFAEMQGNPCLGVVLQATLQWVAKKRPTAVGLLREFGWLGCAAQVPKPLPSYGCQALAALQGKQGSEGLDAAGFRVRPADQQTFKIAGIVPTQGTVRGRCQCAGHCYQSGHRYYKGCSSAVVAKGSRFCYECKCSVPSCERPRLRSELCSKHHTLCKSLPAPMQMVRLTRSLSSALVPCDITEFFHRYQRVRHDPVLVIITAMLKEPIAMAMFETSVPEPYPDGTGYTCHDLAKALEQVHGGVGTGALDKAERQQLNDQGPCSLCCLHALAVSFLCPCRFVFEVTLRCLCYVYEMD
jgi:serine/threonine protein kinase